MGQGALRRERVTVRGEAPRKKRTSRDEARDSSRRALPVRATYRTTRVLGAISESPGSCNRDIAGAAGLTDEGQTSKLLSRLEQRGLVRNIGLGQAYGEPNAWLLTMEGEQVLGVLRPCFSPVNGVPGPRRVRGSA